MTSDRLILFADLLGFKSLVRESPLPDLVRRYHSVFDALFSAGVRAKTRAAPPSLEAMRSSAPALWAAEQCSPQRVLEAITQDTGLHVVVMSDSFVLYSEPLAPDGPAFPSCLTSLALFGRILLMRLFEEGLPARAAIDYGPFHADREAGIYVGRGLVDAYECAESQEWIGGMIAPSLSEHVDALLANHDPVKTRALRPGWDLIRYDVPLKRGQMAAYAINWVTAWNHGGAVRDDFFGSVLTGDPRVDVKYSNTLAFMQRIGTLLMNGCRCSAMPDGCPSAMADPATQPRTPS